MEELKSYLKELIDEGIIHPDIKDEIIHIVRKLNPTITRLYNNEELTKYVKDMEQHAESLGVEFRLCINSTYVEMWDFLEKDCEMVDDEISNEFFKFQAQYRMEHGMDLDILAMSFIRDETFDDFINSDT